MTEQLPELQRDKIILNLDTAERDNVRPPFVFVVSDRSITLGDPGDMDWQTVNALDDEVEYLKEAMSDEDLGFFLEQKIPLWKMEQLGRAYQKHFGAEEPGKAGRSGS